MILKLLIGINNTNTMAEITDEAFSIAHNSYAESVTKPEGIYMGGQRKLQKNTKHEKIVASFVRKTMPIGAEIWSIDFIRNRPLENIVNDHVKHQKDVIRGITHREVNTLDEKGEVMSYNEKVDLPQGTKETGYRFLYHGTDERSMSSIVSSPSGFDPLMCTRSLHGRGNYFSTDADYSLNYSPGTHQPHGKFVFKRILLVKVFVGLYQKGSPNKAADPIGINSVKHNTLVNDLENPTIFVTQSSSQQIPAYDITVRIPVQPETQSTPTVPKASALPAEDEHIKAVITTLAANTFNSKFYIKKDSVSQMTLYQGVSWDPGRWYVLLIKMTPGIISLDQKTKHVMAVEHTNKLISTMVECITSLITSKCITGTVEDFVSPYMDVLSSGLHPSVSSNFKSKEGKFWVDFFTKYSKDLVDTLRPVVKRDPEESSQLGGPAKKVKLK